MSSRSNWRVLRRRVSGEPRIEVIGPGYNERALLKDLGAFVEIVAFQSRTFLPVGEPAVLERVLRHAPIIDVVTQAPEEDEAAGLSRALEGPSAAGGMAPEAVFDAVAKLLTEWDGRPFVQVVATFNDLPERLRRAARGRPETVEGAFWGERIYLVADRLQSPEQVEQVVLHEVVGHVGLRKLLGADYERLLREVVRAYGSAGLKPIAEAYGLDLASPEDRLEAAEERLAHTANRVGNAPAFGRARRRWCGRGCAGWASRFGSTTRTCATSSSARAGGSSAAGKRVARPAGIEAPKPRPTSCDPWMPAKRRAPRASSTGASASPRSRPRRRGRG